MTAIVSPLPEPLPLPRAVSRRSVLAWSFAAALPAGAQAQRSPAAKPPAAPPTALAFELITPGEAAREREARPKNDAESPPEESRPRSLRGAAAPALAIRILVPTPQAAVTAPLRIELAFDAPPGARVVPSTFRVLYGVLKIDLTERLRRFSTINERGVVVDQAVVPDGLHRLFMQVADDKGNVAEQELRLRVGAVS